MNKHVKVGSDLQHNLLSSALIISSGISELDDLLDGGLYSGELTCFQSLDDSLYSKLILKTMALVTLTEQKEVIYITTCQSLENSALLKVMKNHYNNNNSHSAIDNSLKDSQKEATSIVGKSLNFINTIEKNYANNLLDYNQDNSNNIQLKNKACDENTNTLSGLSQNKLIGSQTLIIQRLRQNSNCDVNATIINNNKNITLSDISDNQIKKQNNSINALELDKNIKNSPDTDNFSTNLLTIKSPQNCDYSSNSLPVFISNNIDVNILNALSKIKVLKVYKIHEFFNTLTFLNDELNVNYGIKLLIIGHLDILFLQLIGALKARELTGILSKILQLLKRIAYEHNLAVMLLSFSDKTLRKHLHSDIFKLQVQNYVNIQFSEELHLNIQYNEYIQCNTACHPDTFINLVLEKSPRLPELIKKINLKSLI